MKDSKYSDIINLPHHRSKKRKPMKKEDRAVQFAPFAALTGFYEALAESARLTEKKAELDEYEMEEINNKLQYIQSHLTDEHTVKITYFLKDAKKSGGRYVEKSGVVDKIKVYERVIVLKDKTQIPIDDVYDIVI